MDRGPEVKEIMKKYMGKLIFVIAAVLVLALALPASAQPFSINLTADNLSTIGIITDKDQTVAINVSNALLVNEYSTIRAQLENSSGFNDTTTGVVITFSVNPGTGGNLTNATMTGKVVNATTDANGTASVLLKCLNPIAVQVLASNNSLPVNSTLSSIINQTIWRITLTASPLAINVSQKATLYAQIKDGNGNNISDYAWIKFQVENSSVGRLINSTASGSVVYAQANTNGLATVNFQGTANGSTRIYAFGAYEIDGTAVLIPGFKSVKVQGAAGMPIPINITSWSNNKTNNQSLNFTANQSDNINFNVSTNITADDYTWTLNGSNQGINFNNFTNIFNNLGLTLVNVTVHNSTFNNYDYKNWTVEVIPTPAPPPGAPSITSWGNNKTNDQNLSLTTNTSEAVSFNITANQTVNVTWYINGTLVQTNTSVTDAKYTNTSAVAGFWNVTAIANNTNGTDSKTWDWNVTSPPPVSGTSLTNITPVTQTIVALTTATYVLNLTNTGTLTDNYTLTFDNPDNALVGLNISSPVMLASGASQIFELNVKNTLAGTFQVNVTATSQNDPTKVAFVNTTTNVTVTAPGAPNITSFAPSSPVSDIAGASRTFNIGVNQTVNVTWYINGTLVQTNTSVTDAKYTNTNAVAGFWNVTAIATNNNGTASQEWLWNVSAVPTPTPTPTPTPKPCRDFVSGGGWIEGNSVAKSHKSDENSKATFGVSGGIINGKFWGQLSYNDHNGVNVKSSSVTAYTVIDPVTRQIEGIARVNGKGSFTYTVVVVDNGDAGRNKDSFSLVLSNGYNASGTLKGGNIQLHKECRKPHDNDDKENYDDKDERDGHENCDNDRD